MTDLAFDLEYMGPEEYTRFVEERTAYYRELLKDMDITQ